MEPFDLTMFHDLCFCGDHFFINPTRYRRRSFVAAQRLTYGFVLDENSQFLLKRLLDSATEELLARQHKVLAQAQLGLPERAYTPSTNSVSRGIVKMPSKAGLTKQVVDSIERIETQLSAFQFCSTRRGDRTARPCKSHSGVTPTEEEEEDYYLSSVIPFQRSMEPRQSYLRNRQMSRQTTRTSSVAPSLRSLNNNATNITGTETGTSSEGEEQVYSTEEASRETTVSTSGSSWETHAESVTESGSSYPSESDYDDDENSRVSDFPPQHNRSKLPAKQRKKAATGRLKRIKEKLGKVFHHHHYHHHKEEDQGRKPSAWKHLVKKHLNKDKEKLVEKQMKTESRGLKHNKKGGEFHALVKGFMRHHRRHSKLQTTLKRQGSPQTQRL
ncbi:hypothetical protein F2Q70_00010932 [Brassica cretica]|uniref:Uncharacterized protein n=1 Tax=Brassica cretica TaxID=69181 RepID=A0A8S9MB16_BRACR|nr:hypothetical protein F2Q70_00010932 [Brassica cretica]